MDKNEILPISELRFTYNDYVKVIKLYKGLSSEIKAANKNIDRLSQKEIVKATLGDVLELISSVQYLEQLHDLTHSCEEYMKKYNECIVDSIMKNMNHSRTLN